MCYPKPGPRCSAHAAAAFAKAHQKVLHAFMNNTDDAKLEKLRNLREKAQKEYDITPAGIRDYERRQEEHPSDAGKEQLDKLKQKRAARIAQVHNVKQVKHRTPANDQYRSTFFSKTGDEVTPMSYNHPDLLTSMQHSQKWAYKLNDEEIATMAWYSQAGYADINGRLSSNGSDPYARRNAAPEKSDKAIQIMDAALNKYEPTTGGVIVYRRHHFYNEEGRHVTIPLTEIQAQFPVGSEYEPNFFMSSSLDPANLPPKDGGSAGLQILTKTGAPVTAISSQGPREYEFVIPRGAKFRVVANDVKMKTKNRQGEASEVTVIQLEEI